MSLYTHEHQCIIVTFLGANIHHVSRTQSTIALSSAEAELYAIGLGASEALYVRALLLESGLCPAVEITLYTDSSAAKSMSNHFGSSKKAKHIEIRYFYIQNLIKDGVITLKKTAGTRNPAETLTKHISYEILSRHLSSIGICANNNFF